MDNQSNEPWGSQRVSILSLSSAGSAPECWPPADTGQQSTEIHQQLELLQQEINQMNQKLMMNEAHLNEKKLENQQLRELLGTLQHRLQPNSQGEAEPKSGCCSNMACAIT